MRRKLLKTHRVDVSTCVKIYRDLEYDEYQVVMTQTGITGIYYTTDRQDAFNTARLEVDKMNAALRDGYRHRCDVCVTKGG